MRVVPRDSHLNIVNEGNALAIVIPSKRNWFAVAFLSVWLCGWLGGELSAISALGTDGATQNGKLFLLFWLCGWTLGGAGAWTFLAWNIAGRELVTLTGEHLSVRYAVRGIGFTRDYDLDHVSRLRVEGTHVDWSAPAFRKRNRGRVAFDYGASTVRFGHSIDDPDARRIVEVLGSRRPTLLEARTD